MRAAWRAASTATCSSSMSPTSARTPCSSTTPTATTRASRSALARLADRPTEPTPIGIFRAVERPLHGAAAAVADPRPVADTTMLDALLHSGDTWTVA